MRDWEMMRFDVNKLESNENEFDAKINHLNHGFHRFFLIDFCIFCENLWESVVKTKNASVQLIKKPRGERPSWLIAGFEFRSRRESGDQTDDLISSH